MKLNNKPVQILDGSGNPMRQSMSGFEAGADLKEFRSWGAPLNSANEDLLPSYEQIKSRTKSLANNNGIASGIGQTYVDNIIGTGFTLQAKPAWKILGFSEEWAEGFAETVETYWKLYSQSKNFDLAGKFNFNEATKVTYNTVFHSGDSLALAHWRPKLYDLFATRFQLVDPDRLSNPPEKALDPNIKGGIKFNRDGEATVFYIRGSHESDGWQNGKRNKWTAVRAKTKWGRSRVIHVQVHERIDQARGKPTLTSVVRQLKMAEHYDRAELQAAVLAAKFAMFLESPMDGETLTEMFSNAEEYNKARDEFEVRFNNGAITRLFPGEKITSETPGRPNKEYGPFNKALHRQTSAGAHIPYELVMKDFSDSSYSALKGAFNEAWRFFMGRRQMVVSGWCNEVYKLFIEELVQKQLVDAPNFYQNIQAYCQAEWIGTGRGYLDRLKEAKGQTEQLANGSISLKSICAENGEDWKDVIDQQARENDYRRSKNLPLLEYQVTDYVEENSQQNT